MIEPEIKSCSRCNQKLNSTLEHCSSGEHTEFQISQKAKEFLLKTKFCDLCSTCHEEIETFALEVQNNTFPLKKEDFIEGKHYYYEGNYWVFTALYHALRGSCCESGCRHCPYGFKKNLK